ncbi:AfsR/SARP family transcriptional regulator [Actinokineospora iranica]|uniref:AfsR/SARP family transcriptional regulator n=1 Tax=Actinokineospora iranica TaxID=1271860 RepID=UPI001E2FA12C|nr:BTAD domain-containing putative transcriptional regulator [Actinokineospora iranica]
MSILVSTATPPRQAIPRGGTGVRVSLLGGFRLLADDRVLPVSGGTERLLAFVALHHQAAGRLLVAGTLWSEVSEVRAYATLRSALSRMDPASRETLKVMPLSLQLAQGVGVDLRDAQALARRLITARRPAEADLGAGAVASLSLELLPLWYDDWVLREAEDWRQLRLHALEALADGLTAVGRFAEATTAAGAAVRADPLRETAHSGLIRVHLAEGNQSEALRAFARFSHLLHTDLGLTPTPRCQALVANLLNPHP